MVYEEKAKLLMLKAKGLGEDQAAFLDQTTIALGLTFLKEIIALYKSCNRPAAMTADNMKKPGLIARRRLKNIIAAHQLPEGVTAKQMHAAALEVGKTITLTDVEEMYTAA